MRIEAATIEEFFQACGRWEEEIRLLDGFLQKAAPHLERKLYATPTITLLGYGVLPAAYQSGGRAWPLLSIAPQKNHIALYVAASKGDLSLVEAYAGLLGKVSPGKGCVRFTKYANLQTVSLTAMVGDAVAWMEDANHPRRG